MTVVTVLSLVCPVSLCGPSPCQQPHAAPSFIHTILSPRADPLAEDSFCELDIPLSQ